MKRLQLLLIPAGFVMLALVLAQPVKATISTQQAQIAFTIVVDVLAPTASPTPLLLGYVPRQAPATGARPAISAVSFRHITPDLEHGFHAENLQFEGESMLVAQAQVQHSVLVQAEVTPNPKATILYTDVAGSSSTSVTITQTAGTTEQWPCIFTVTVDMLSTWILDEGISNDFDTAWSGKDLANDTYVQAATPKPTSTPYVVYADDGKVWSQAATGTTKTTYCVTLTLTVPLATTAGDYSTNAIYTLFN
jgi:hypothetical protein